MLVVVDTNIFISSIFSNRFPNAERILELEEAGSIKFVFSALTRNELFKIVSRKIEEHNEFECYEFIKLIMDIVDRSAYIESPPKLPTISTDKGDQPFIELALHANAQFLITDDHSNGLLDLATINNVEIVTSTIFVRRYNRYLRTGTNI